MHTSTLRKLLGRPAAKVNLPRGFSRVLRFYLKDRAGLSLVSINRQTAADLARRGALVEILPDRDWVATVDASWIGMAG